MIDFPEIFAEIVAKVRTKYDTENGVLPYFEVGTYAELVKVNAMKDKNIIEKYPLIWLVWEADESKVSRLNNKMYNVSPRIFICTHTSTEKSSAERLSENFELILNPIWELLNRYITYDTHVDWSSKDNYQKADHLLWGESLGYQKNKNVLFDTLDAIEIKYNNLLIIENC